MPLRAGPTMSSTGDDTDASAKGGHRSGLTLPWGRVRVKFRRGGGRLIGGARRLLRLDGERSPSVGFVVPATGDEASARTSGARRWLPQRSRPLDLAEGLGFGQMIDMT